MNIKLAGLLRFDALLMVNQVNTDKEASYAQVVPFEPAILVKVLLVCPDMTSPNSIHWHKKYLPQIIPVLYFR